MIARRGLLVTTMGLFMAAASVASTSATASSLMATGGMTSQPIGHFEFCRKLPRECSLRLRDNGPLRASRGMMRKIASVNISVNRAVKAVNDSEIYGKNEVWAYPTKGIGDCEDFVLEKRRRLNAAGIPLSNLLITVVRKRDGEGHAVLTVRTNQGDLILDNLNNEVKLWSHTGYKYLKRQATTHTGRWVSLRNENNVLVGSVR